MSGRRGRAACLSPVYSKRSQGGGPAAVMCPFLHHDGQGEVGGSQVKPGACVHEFGVAPGPTNRSRSMNPLHLRSSVGKLRRYYPNKENKRQHTTDTYHSRFLPRPLTSALQQNATTSPGRKVTDFDLELPAGSHSHISADRPTVNLDRPPSFHSMIKYHT